MNFSIVCLLLAILATFAQADLATESFLLDLLEGTILLPDHFENTLL